MSFFEILTDEVISSKYLVAIFIVLIIIAFYKRKELGFNFKRKNRTELVVAEEDSFKNDFFKLNELKDSEEFQKDANEIMKSVGALDTHKDEVVKVPFAKAMYILKNFKNYNVFSSEEGEIIFKKLKNIIDHSEKIDTEEIKVVETEKIKTEKDSKVVSELGPNHFKVENPNGYTIVKNGVVLESVNYTEELKRAEEDKKRTNDKTRTDELSKKIEMLEDKILKSDTTKKINTQKLFEEKNDTAKNNTDSKEEKQTTDKDTSVEKDKNTSKEKSNKDIEDDMTDDINSLTNSFLNISSLNINAEETKDKPEDKEETKDKPEDKEETKDKPEDKEETKDKPEDKEETKDKPEDKEETKDKPEDTRGKLKKIKLNYTKNDLEQIENDNLVFILETFEDDFFDRLDFLLKDMLNVKNLKSNENKLVFCDIDLERSFLYIDIYLFLKLFLNYFNDYEKVKKIFMFSNEALNIENVKKILYHLNQVSNTKYGDELFFFTGKNKNPFVQRNLKLNFGTSSIISCQMLKVNLLLLNNNFGNDLESIREHILKDIRLKVIQIKLNENKENIISLDMNLFE